MPTTAAHFEINDVDEHQIAFCYPLMRQLRPQLASAEDLASRWRRQSAQGYRIVGLWQHNQPLALAGYRMTESLIHGPFLYVDDLVVDSALRSAGYGALLMDWLENEGRRTGCAKLVLDTGLDNALAQRFYYRQGLLAMALRFATVLN
ncbi:GNAT family N-acetyltransferase [Mycolicibacterium sp. CH28]|uniref:GNAT family N-acetyltransferase n=1 Tax=Mycolicibacterium sp. CH28 TaxID=2512237 RepID=UPI001080BBF0|nr:GNAT family N-acetyltransferase [Mycolicibacterium sp. CH28]TGD87315.1 GNAT family N-acetyltransferase [Mycolicibacterium sp. CH28]